MIGVIMELRKYQRTAVDMVWDYLIDKHGHPVLNLPTGSGKSHVIATLCKEALQKWPGSRVLMVTHQSELISQNLEKLLHHWPNAPVGVYSASLGEKTHDEPIVYAGIQSIWNKSELIGHRDMILVDEAHAIGHEETGTYRRFLDDMMKINPWVRIVGLTASPYRLGHGLITDDPAIFDDILEPVTIQYLQAAGYLADLRSKHTHMNYDTKGVGKRGGDFIESELQKRVDTDSQNARAVDEIIKRAGDTYKHWLIFCTGVKHAEHVRDVFKDRGISCEAVTGKTNNREDILKRFKAGEITCLTSVEVLTTGFDAPDTDLIALLRPSMSPGLFLQIVGRGLRIKGHIDHCIILDFAGLIATHGPITNIRPPKKKGEGGGVPPSKLCPECDEILPASAKFCKACGYQFPEHEKEWSLRDDDIMGRDTEVTMDVESWYWAIEKSKAGNDMVTVKYFPKGLGDPPIKEYFSVWNEKQWVARKAQAEMLSIMQACGCLEPDTDALTKSPCPERIVWKKENNFPRVIRREWEDAPF